MTDALAQLMAAAGRPVAPSPGTPHPRPSEGDLSALMEERGAANNGDLGMWADVKRICALPVWGPLSDPELDALTRMYCLEKAWQGGFRLLEEQARCIKAFDSEEGLIAPVPVGRGKTLIAMALAARSYARGMRKSMILVPSNTVLGFMEQLPQIRTWIPCNVPVHVMTGSRRQRERLAKSNTPGTYLMPYSMLSTEDTVDLLNDIEPGLIFADEVDKLKWSSAGRTKRITRYLHTHPHCKFAGASGTITNKSIKDYWHLMMWALGERAPLPVSNHLAGMLAAVLDSQSDPTPRQIREWAPLTRWARTWFPGEGIPSPSEMDVRGLRKAYRLRLNSAPGVVSSSGADMLNTKLMLRNTPVEADPEDKDRTYLFGLMKKVEEMHVAPTGEDIPHALHTHKWLRELTSGFYNKLVWPEPAVLAARRRLDLDDATELLERARRHLEAKQKYTAQLIRWFKEQHIDHVDTPRLVGQSMSQHGEEVVGPRLYAYWKIMKDLEFEDMPKRDRVPVRVCDYKIRQAVEWARGVDGGIIWHHHQEIGRWLVEALTEAGLDVVACPAGANAIILDHANRNKIIVASISAHGTGKNLQHHQHQLVVEWPRSAPAGEQLLGRVHRTGQEAEILYVDTMDSTMFDVMNRAAGLVDSLYHSQTTGNPLKAVFCQYDPLPVVMPPEVLRERGFENELLDRHQQAALLEKFRLQPAAS